MKTSKLIKIFLISLCLVALSSGYLCDAAGGANCNAQGDCTGAVCGDCATGYLADGDGKCLLCDDGYTVDGTAPIDTEEGGCQICTALDNCATCETDEEKCLTCTDNNFVIKTTPATGCEACNALDTNCATCHATLRQCLTCASLYTPKADKSGCDLCTTLTGCATCSVGTRQCLTCTDNTQFVAVDELSCQTCAQRHENCAACTNLGACQTCADGYYLDNLACTECPDNVAICSDETTFTECKVGYTLKAANNCQACDDFSEGCTECSQTGTAACTTCNPLTHTLVDGLCEEVTTGTTGCHETALTCQQGTNKYAATCKPGYTLPATDNIACDACTAIDGCTAGDTACSGTERKCQICATGKYPNNLGACVTCDATTTACNSQTGFPTACVAGKTLPVAGNGVIACVLCNTLSDCNTCSQTARECTDCNAHHYLKDDKSCGTCGTGAITCDATKALTCDGDGSALAGSNYVLASTEQAACVACSTLTTDCDTCANDARECLTCTGTKALNRLGACVASTTTGCDTSAASCTDTTDKFALVCKATYTPPATDNTKCDLCTTAITGCTTCSQTHRECTVCDATPAVGVYLKDGACPKCTTQTGVKTCNSVTGVHLTCNDKFYLTSTNTCTACGTKAATCEASTGNAVTCESGYKVPTTPGKDCISDGTGGGQTEDDSSNILSASLLSVLALVFMILA